MRVTLDSSVLVAAHISRAGVCAELLEAVLLGHEVVVSDFILEELRAKLAGKFGFPEELVEAAVASIRSVGVLVDPAVVPHGICRDHEDLPVLGTAVAGGSVFLVTVDKDLLAVGAYRGVSIIKPGEFWRRARGG